MATGNALTVLRRRRKLTLDEARTAIRIIRELPAVIDHEAAAMAFTRLVDLATQHELTIYDARMKDAAIRSGVGLWQDEVSDK